MGCGFDEQLINYITEAAFSGSPLSRLNPIEFEAVFKKKKECCEKYKKGKRCGKCPRR